MRIHAEVSRARHERRHSDVSLSYTELDEPGFGRQSRAPLAGGPGPRSYSMDRTSPGPRTSNHSPPTPHRSPVLGGEGGVGGRRGLGDPLRKPVPQPHHLDPSSAMRRTSRDGKTTDGMLRNDSLSSDQSESVVRPSPLRAQRSKRMGKMRQTGSFSSSEEELVTTPEYTSCEDVELESELIWLKAGRPVVNVASEGVTNFCCQFKTLSSLVTWLHHTTSYHSGCLTELLLISNCLFHLEGL